MDVVSMAFRFKVCHSDPDVGQEKNLVATEQTYCNEWDWMVAECTKIPLNPPLRKGETIPAQ